METPFVGEITLASSSFPPRGWLLCDGSLLKISDYQVLFSLIGTLYGGDGVTNFAVPDLRGRVPVGIGQGPNLTPVNPGDKKGTETVTLAAAQIPLHSHLVFASSGNGTTQAPGNCVYAANANAKIWAAAATPYVAMDADMLTKTGNSLPHENRMPLIAMNYYIAFQGIYPTRP